MKKTNYIPPVKGPYFCTHKSPPKNLTKVTESPAAAPGLIIARFTTRPTIGSPINHDEIRGPNRHRILADPSNSSSWRIYARIPGPPPASSATFP